MALHDGHEPVLVEPSWSGVVAVIGLMGRRTVDSRHIGPYLGGGELAGGDVVTGADIARENAASSTAGQTWVTTTARGYRHVTGWQMRHGSCRQGIFLC